MSATIRASSAICSSNLRTSSRFQPGQVALVRPGIFRSTTPKRSSATTFSIGGGGEKKVLRREEEPDEYWTSERERKGESPFKDPLALIGILAILFPFIFLGIAIATGLVDLSAGR